MTDSTQSLPRLMIHIPALTVLKIVVKILIEIDNDKDSE